MKNNWVIKWFCWFFLISVFNFTHVVDAKENNDGKFTVEVTAKKNTEFVVTVTNVSQTIAKNIAIQTTVPDTLASKNQTVSWNVDKMSKDETREFIIKLDKKSQQFKPTSKHGKVLPKTGVDIQNSVLLSLIGIILLGLAYYLVKKNKDIWKIFSIFILFLPLSLFFKNEIVLADSNERFNYENKVTIESKEHIFRTEITASFVVEESDEKIPGSKTEETTKEISDSKKESSTSETSSSEEKSSTSETSSSDEESSTSESSSDGIEGSTDESIDSDGKSEVAITGYVYNANEELLIKKVIRVYKDNKLVEEVETDDQGYFFTHLTLGETYTLHGGGFEVTVVAKDLNIIDVVPVLGKLTLGRILKEENGTMDLMDSAIFLNPEEISFQLSADYSQLIVDGHQLFNVGDIIVLPPTDEYLGGLGFKVTQIKESSNQMILNVIQAELEESVKHIKGNAQNIPITNGVFIPNNQVSVMSSRISGESNTSVSTNLTLDLDGIKIAIKFKMAGKISIEPDINVFDLGNATLKVKPEFAISVENEMDIRKKFKGSKHSLGNVFIPIGIPGVTINLDLYLVFDVDGKITVGWEYSDKYSFEAGIEKGKFYKTDISNDLDLDFSISGSVEAKTGIDAAVSVAALTRIKALELSLGSGVIATTEAKHLINKSVIELKGAIEGYREFEASIPLLKLVNGGGESGLKFYNAKWKIKLIDEQIELDPNNNSSEKEPKITLDDFVGTWQTTDESGDTHGTKITSSGDGTLGASGVSLVTGAPLAGGYVFAMPYVLDFRPLQDSTKQIQEHPIQISDYEMIAAQGQNYNPPSRIVMSQDKKSFKVYKYKFDYGSQNTVISDISQFMSDENLESVLEYEKVEETYIPPKITLDDFVGTWKFVDPAQDVFHASKIVRLDDNTLSTGTQTGAAASDVFSFARPYTLAYNSSQTKTERHPIQIYGYEMVAAQGPFDTVPSKIVMSEDKRSFKIYTYKNNPELYHDGVLDISKFMSDDNIASVREHVKLDVVQEDKFDIVLEKFIGGWSVPNSEDLFFINRDRTITFPEVSLDSNYPILATILYSKADGRTAMISLGSMYGSEFVLEQDGTLTVNGKNYHPLGYETLEEFENR